jgi:hypothetical protein
MSMTSLKGLVNNVSNPKPLEPSAKQTGINQHVPNTRKPLNKRNTVFKDTLEPLAETKESASKENVTEVTDENKGTATSSPATEQDITKDDARLNQASKIQSDDTEEYSIVNSDDIDGINRDLYKADDDNCKVQVIEQLPEHGATTNEVDDLPKAHRESASSAHLAQSEPEEYWDEEDDENEEDDGYVTARSYRSRGDNTTGGATTILFPKYNPQVRRELALAKQVVEATRTAEDIEDEYWDTSMVAEYSDEIFEYMREQEVCCSRSI